MFASARRFVIKQSLPLSLFDRSLCYSNILCIGRPFHNKNDSIRRSANTTVLQDEQMRKRRQTSKDATPQQAEEIEEIEEFDDVEDISDDSDFVAQEAEAIYDEKPAQKKGKTTASPSATSKEKTKSPVTKKATAATTKRKATTTTRRSNNNNDNDSLVDIEECFGFKSEDEKLIKDIRTKLLDWYDENQRVLPWRKPSPKFQAKLNSKRNNKTTDSSCVTSSSSSSSSSSSAALSDPNVHAYRVWVSEIMLQQTRVQAVIDYYNRWMSKFPTVQHLATASLEQVNEMWAGLGYYSRAKNLHKAAKEIVQNYGGVIPSEAEQLRKLSGIGEYTSGAVASIAFGRVEPVVDGNVIRVLSRLRAIDRDPKKDTKVNKLIWKLARSVVDPERPGDFNQALMELGAMVCTPKSPQCESCPVSAECRAFQAVKKGDIDSAEVYPAKTAKAQPRAETVVVCIVHTTCKTTNSKKYLLVRRPETGLLANLWEFPQTLATTVDTNNNNDNDNDNIKKEEEEEEEEEEADGGGTTTTTTYKRKAAAKKKKKKKTTTTTTVNANTTSADFSDLLVKFLSTTFRISTADALSPIAVCGEVEHIFSHIRQRLIVHCLEVAQPPPTQREEDGAKADSTKVVQGKDYREVRWMTKEEIGTAAIPKVMKKVFDKYIQSLKQPTLKVEKKKKSGGGGGGGIIKKEEEEEEEWEATPKQKRQQATPTRKSSSTTRTSSSKKQQTLSAFLKRAQN